MGEIKRASEVLSMDTSPRFPLRCDNKDPTWESGERGRKVRTQFALNVCWFLDANESPSRVHIVGP